MNKCSCRHGSGSITKELIEKNNLCKCWCHGEKTLLKNFLISKYLIKKKQEKPYYEKEVNYCMLKNKT